MDNAHKGLSYEDEIAPNDCLGFQESAHSLARQIIDSELPLAIGLFGQWGAGKSTYLSYLAATLQESKGQFFPVTYEPWKLEDSDSILYDMVSAIYFSAQEAGVSSDKAEENARGLFRLLENIQAITAREAVTGLFAGIAGRIVGTKDLAEEALSSVWDRKPLDKAKERMEAASLLPDAFTKYVSSLSSVPVVLIDDLDRCRPETLISVIEGLKLFLQGHGTAIVYILAMDHRMVTQAICSRYGFRRWHDGWQFLSKICNFFFFVPRPRIKGLLQQEQKRLRKEQDGLELFWECLKSQSIEHMFYACDLYLPRRLKRVVRHMHTALSPMVLGLAKSVQEAIERNSEALPVPAASVEKECYRFLLGVFILRETYPELYYTLEHKLNEQRASFLIDLGTTSGRTHQLDRRASDVQELATRHGLSELHPFLSDQVLLDLLQKLFSRESLVQGYPREDQDLFEVNLREKVLNPVLDVMMSA